MSAVQSPEETCVSQQDKVRKLKTTTESDYDAKIRYEG